MLESRKGGVVLLFLQKLRVNNLGHSNKMTQIIDLLSETFLEFEELHRI